jgi:hypothetical protein
MPKKLIFNKTILNFRGTLHRVPKRSLHLFLIGQPDMEAPKILGVHLQKLVIENVKVYNNLWAC